MSRAGWMIAALSICSLAGCAQETGALFSDVQRTPPVMKRTTAEYLVRNDRAVAVWIGETKLKCERFSCVQ